MIPVASDYAANPGAVAAAGEMNRLGASRTPFLFLFDYAGQQPIVTALNSIDPAQIRYSIRGRTNDPTRPADDRCAPKISVVDPPSPQRYRRAFDLVQDHLRRGNSYLVNLTFPTRIHLNTTLLELYHHSEAKYRVFVRDRFVCFSPEPFLCVRGRTISSYPMKGTRVGAGEAESAALLADAKEHAEHTTIVDLIRNDIGRVARNVRVHRFRYVETLQTDAGALLQMSSQIDGDLDADWPQRIGDILLATLPAGSITGAPKTMTCRIIAEAEGYDRGFYTGVVGIFDGESLDTGVLIRFVEQDNDGVFWFKSGGGITIHSDNESEYRELLAKIYVPLYRNHPR
jgi:para-aminobenzoate synthetase component I